MGAHAGTARVALAGYGVGGSVFHAPFIDAEPRLELSAVVTSDPRRRSAVRDRYPDTVVMGSFDELLAGIDQVDVVVISTPNRTHVSMAQSVLAEGRDVVVDKPVAPSAAEVRRLARMAAEGGRLLVPFHNRRFDGDFLTVAALLGSGRLGTLHRFESRYERWLPEVGSGPQRSWKRDPTPGHATGILYDLGTHLIDQAALALGRPDAVYAEIDVRRPGAAVDDDVFVALHYPGGLRAHLWASAVAAERGPRFRLLGSAGSYVKYGMDVQEAALVGGGRPSDAGWGAEPSEAWGTLTTSGGRQLEPTVPGAYQQFYAGLAASLIEGAPPPVDAADAVVVAEIVEAARRSAGAGEVVALPRTAP
ncbi:MAG TPA: Gfo/Idh/MocA family oxidoreductase [Acidimicrobiales bacterium]|nr:Gfo/Idh/MocA family oxidoreductase [Acidimicrobiales bacterium]